MPLQPSIAEGQPSISAADINDLYTRRSSISILTDDILALIFEINSQEMASWKTLAHQKNYDIPLSIARAESQVCRRWRTLILDLPIVWGRCIYLAAFGDEKGEWWEEVLRRTQQSPLWIVGQVYVTAPESMEDSAVVPRTRFMHLLKLWERIQKINMVIRGANIPTYIRDAFCRPAPILERFEIHLPDFQSSRFLSHPPLQLGPTRSLFSDYAPAIKEINANSVKFRASAPWLANIRHITITSSSLVYVSPLELISRLPLLETIDLQSRHRDWRTLNTMQLPTPAECRARLPHLRVIRASFQSLANCMAFLYHILPANDFSLQVGVVFRDTILGITDSEDTSLVRPKTTPKDVLPRYITNYFSAQNPTSILILAHRDSFMERFDLSTITKRFDPDERAFFRTKFYPGHGNPETIASVIDAFVESTKLQPRLFDTVTRLSMYLEVDILTSTRRALRSLVYAFQSVEHLKINDGGIHFITMLSLQPDSELNNDAANVLLPKIQTLEIADLHETPGRNVVDWLVAFLNQRRSVGLPIMKVDFTPTVHSLRDLGVLDKVEGLEVVWKSGDQIVSHICGSGNPEKLRFTTV